MKQKKMISSIEIMDFLKKYDFKDIAIALMQMELRDGKYPITLDDYRKFETVYNFYLNDNKYNHLTGLLNEVLQNADEVYMSLKEEYDYVADLARDKNL